MPESPGTAAPVVHLLHTPRLVLADGPTHALERKDAALLAMLATEGPWPAARAAGMLWPDTPDAQARTNLRQRLYRLRKLARSEIVSAKSSLQLRPDLTVDVLQFPSALANDPSAGNGELLGGHDYGDTGALEHWVESARERWRQQRMERLAARASELEAQQQIAAALVLALRMVADDPLHEHAHRRLMRLHYLRGDRGAALAAFAQCRDTLRHELGARPNQETTQLAALIESSGKLQQVAPAPRAITTLRPPRLIGREAPWLRLVQARSHATLALLEGEAGIGKTRLLGDFAEAHGDAPVFGGRPGDTGLPYALLARIVRGLVARMPAPGADWVLPELARVAPELGAAANGQLSTLRLQQALVQALTEWRTLGLDLIVVDDLHHADSATLELLPALTAGVRDPGIAWLLGVRHGELPPAVAQWADEQDVEALDRIALGPLDVGGVRALLESLALPGLDADRWAPTLAQHTGGNPLFVLETLIALLDRPGAAGPDLGGEPPALPAPERIGRLIERRLAQLTPAALKLARVAAIAGQDFSASLAARVLGQHALDIADSWRELEAALVIRDYAFAHDLIFEGTLRSIPQPIARLLHHDVAVALQGAGAPAARLAAHWQAAHEWAAAGAACVDAARAAFATSRRVDEADLWDQAVRCYERAGHADLAFEARRDSIDTCLATRTSDSVLLLTEALLSTARTDAQRLDALLAHGRSLLTAGRRADATLVSDEAIALAQALGGPWQRLAAAALSALCLTKGRRAAEGIERLRGFAVLVEAEGSSVQRQGYYADLAVALHQAGRRGEAALIYPLGIDAARATGDTSEELIMTSNLGGLLSQLGRVGAGRVHAERSCRLLERVGNPDGISAASAFNMLALFDTLTGRFDMALRGFDQALHKLGAIESGSHHAVMETNLANVWVQLGQPTRALQAVKPISAAVAAQAPHTAARRLTIEARIDRALGKPTGQRLLLAMQALKPDADPLLRMLTELDHNREIDPADALIACERVQREAGAMEMLAIEMRARVLAVEAHRRAGQVEQAAALAREAITTWHDCHPADMYWPEALWIVYHALRDAGDESAAQEVLDEATHWIRHTAFPHVPEPFRDGFLHRNPVNAAILAAASRYSNGR